MCHHLTGFIKSYLVLKVFLTTKSTLLTKFLCLRAYSLQIMPLAQVSFSNSSISGLTSSSSSSYVSPKPNISSWYDSGKVRFGFCRKITFCPLWDWAETLSEDSKGIFLCWGKFSHASEFGKDLQYRPKQVVWILLFTYYLTRILFLKGCGNLFWEFSSSTRIFNELKHNFQEWQ